MGDIEMTVDKVKLKALAEGMKGWDKMTECWPCDENGPDWQVGRLDEDDNRWPLLTIDTEQYDQEQDAPKVAQYYAAANPVAVLALLTENDRNAKNAAEWEAASLHWMAERDQLKAENEQLRAKLEKIRDRPCSVHGATADSVIPNALDAWGRPVPQYLPYDFSGNPGASATQYCNGWNDAGGYWKNHCIGLEQKLAGFSSDQKNSDSQETISHA